jgi:hypothetical protein
MSKTKVTQPRPTVQSTPVNGAVTGAPINLEDFRINQDFAAHLQVRKTVVTVPVQKPDRQTWVYIHPDPTFRMSVGVLDDRENRRTYVVTPQILPEVIGDLIPKMLVAYATKQSTVALWPIRLPDESGRLDTYNESALTIVSAHAGRWVRIYSNQQSRAYDVLESPVVEIPTPQWPTGGFEFLFATAFRGRIIDNINHPYLKMLRGEA